MFGHWENILKEEGKQSVRFSEDTDLVSPTEFLSCITHTNVHHPELAGEEKSPIVIDIQSLNSATILKLGQHKHTQTRIHAF